MTPDYIDTWTRWRGGRHGLASVRGGHELQFVGEERGLEAGGQWTAEALLVSAIEAAVMSAMLEHVHAQQLPLHLYESTARGSFSGDGTRLAEIDVGIRIAVGSVEARDSILSLLSQVQGTPMLEALKLPVHLRWDLEVWPQGARGHPPRPDDPPEPEPAGADVS